ncbi:hypothetical protein QOZ80_3AG0210370 [Eleusine coracana subsp. coracana]|nr:hypothetical protein QOZ80_3AG0210370 [Eleusine coracana subsp. coracana]
MAVSKLVDNLNRQMPVAEKLQRLEMLLIKIHSAVEAAEKHAIENAWLLQWRDKLKDAASVGDEVLASFRQRAMDVQTTSNTDQQQASASSSTSSSAANTGALSFTRSALSDIVQGIRSASKMFSSNDDLKVLSNAVKNLEQLSLDIGEFIRLLQLEVSPKAEQRPTENMEKTNIKKKSFKRVGTVGSRRAKTTPQLDCDTITDATQEERQGELLVSKLRKALAGIRNSIYQADRHDLRDRDWIVSWADILRDAKKQGWIVLEVIAMSTMVDNAKAGEETMVEFDKEYELSRFVRTMESLAEEVIYFDNFVLLCPLLSHQNRV